MAAENRSFDVRINIIFPLLTKSLNDKDVDRIKATGAFNFESRPQVDTAIGELASLSFEKTTGTKERVENLKKEFNNMLGDFARLEKAMEKKASHIVLKYDPEVAENETLTDAEETLFGVATGEITYQMYKKVLDYEHKVNKYISHQSVENQGAFSAVT